MDPTDATSSQVTMNDGQAHTGTAPQALAAIRNAVLSLFRFHGGSHIAAAARRYAAHPQRALQLLGIPA